MYIFPVPSGKWSVEVSTEGYQATSSTTDPHKGKVDGLIAYSDDQDKGWNVGEYSNVAITNNKADNTWKYGHPNLEINSCHFNNRQCLERDAVLSFHVETTGDNAAFFVVGPSVQKQSKYNYAVSYGEWTDRDMELGLVSVSLDEKINSKRFQTKRNPRAGHSKGPQLTKLSPLPTQEVAQLEKENSGIQASETPSTPVIGSDPAVDPVNIQSGEKENSKPSTLPHVPSSSDSDDDPLVAAPDVGFGGTRLLIDTDITTVPDPDTSDAYLRSTQVVEDPWAEVRKHKENSKKPPLGPSSVAGESVSGGSLRDAARARRTGSSSIRSEDLDYGERQSRQRKGRFW